MNLTNELIAIAHQYEVETAARIFHVDSRMGASRYVSDAQLIKRSVGHRSTVLDIGCGWGQMSYLLKRLGLQVVATDIRKETPFFVKHYNDHFHDGHIAYHVSNILDSESVNSLDGMKFDAICMSGVLEHVSDISFFLKRLRPLLVQNGKLFIFRFPNRYSWIEKINEYRFGNKIDHPLRFTGKEVDFILRLHGYRVDTTAFEEIFPVNLNGFPEPLIKMYHGIDLILMPISKLLCKIPLINQVSTSYRFTCTKAYDY